MNTKDISDQDEALKFVTELAESGNVVDVVKTIDKQFHISWIASKKYIAQDGKEYTDEVWIKEDGTMIACQDLELEHAKNIIRMILCKERVEQQQLESILEALDSLPKDGIPVDTLRTLH